MKRIIRKSLYIISAFALIVLLTIPALAAQQMLVDEAGLLSFTEAAMLRGRLEKLSNKHNADIVIVTVEGIGKATPMEFADDFFDNNGYGRGENYDGILLLISMAERDLWISTTGKAIDVFSDAGIEYIGNNLATFGLSSGNYAKAFNRYADLCDAFFTKADSGAPFDTGHMPKEFSNLIVVGMFSFPLGLIISFIVTGSMRKQLKSVKKKRHASDYVRQGSFYVSYSDDRFLDTNVVKTRIPVQTSSSGGGSSGGSSTHTSSSGRSHGGGGRKF